MRKVSARGALAGLLASLALVSAAMAGGLTPNPANDPRLVDKPMDNFSYDRARGCDNDVPRGMKAMEKWLNRNVRGETWGIYRCSRLGSGWSVHADSRAIDWHLDARNKRNKKAGMRLLRTMIERDRNGEVAALARRMGVQGLIYNCKAWFGGGDRLGKYSYCYNANGHKKDNLDPTQAHIDHVHLELNKRGAKKKTSFWKSPLAP